MNKAELILELRRLVPQIGTKSGVKDDGFTIGHGLFDADNDELDVALGRLVIDEASQRCTKNRSSEANDGRGCVESTGNSFEVEANANNAEDIDVGESPQYQGVVGDYNDMFLNAPVNLPTV